MIKIEQYKIEYNNLLKRYNNGIKYLQQNQNTGFKWYAELQSIMNQLSEMITKYNITGDNILEGFKEE